MHNINKKNMIYIVALLSYQFMFAQAFFFLKKKRQWQWQIISACNVHQDETTPPLFPFTLIDDSQVKCCLKPNILGIVTIKHYFTIIR